MNSYVVDHQHGDDLQRENDRVEYHEWLVLVIHGVYTELKCD